LQDGENMVKQCDRKNHTHDPLDSNYSNAVDGIDRVIAEVQRQRPAVIWENCENGGNMMTFQMVQQYTTSITDDASGPLGSRQGVWGATYPFSPRYADRYMPDDPSNTYITRSYMFGGPWYFMVSLSEMPAESLAIARREVGTYKSIRDSVATGQVFHLMAGTLFGSPGDGAIDAIESYDAKKDAAVAIVSRNGGSADNAVIRIQGLQPDQGYRVSFADDPRQLLFSGRQLIRDGVLVNLPGTQSAEIVYVDSAPF
jgi:alpha-galactosidase